MRPLVLLCLCVALASAGSFWHVADIHWDPLYLEGAPSICKKSDYIMCCENNSIPDSSGAAPAGRFGNYACDSPIGLVQSALSFMNTSANNNVSWILWTGDDTPHNIFGQNMKDNLENIRLTSQFMLETFPDMVVVPLLGNHDYWPVSRWEMPPHCGWLLSNVSQWWSKWLPADAIQTFLIGGYYSVLVEPGLRVIALNTNFYDAWDPYAHLLSSKDDPGNQLAWLNATLFNATQNGEMVYIAGHVAPGIRSSSGHKDVVDTFNVRYIQLVQQYFPVIAGQFFAHWHRDEFKIFRSANNTPISVAWLTSSITPYHNVNPSVRKYYYDSGSSKELLNYEVYYMNLSKANAEGVMEWEFEYSPLESYVNVTDMKPATWLQFANSYMTNSTLFSTFYDFHTVQCPIDTCTSKKCMKTMYCSTVWVDNLKYDECYHL